MQKMSVEPSALGNVCSLIHSDIYKNDIYVTHSGSDQHDRKIKRCTSVVCDTVREITSDAFILAPELEVHQIHLSLLSITSQLPTIHCFLVSRTLDGFDNYSTF